MRAQPRTVHPASLDYVQRVNRALDHIVQNLDQPLDLDTLARVACFSPFHFHRVFKALMGETPHECVKRLRLERALHLLLYDAGRSIIDIAVACGFGSASDFSRSFRQRFGVAPRACAGQALRDGHRAGLPDNTAPDSASHRLESLPQQVNPCSFVVRLRHLPRRTVAYIRVHDSFRPGVVPEAAARLLAWAETQGCADRQWLGYMWDNPEIVAPQDCRYDVAVEVDGGTAEGEIGRLQFPPMQVAEVEVRGGIELEMQALEWLFGTWLPRSGFVPADQPVFEAWIGRPFAHGREHFELCVQLPVEAASGRLARRR